MVEGNQADWTFSCSSVQFIALDSLAYPMSDGVKDNSGCEMGSSCGVLLLLLLLLPDPLNQPLNKLELSAEQQAEECSLGGEETRVAKYAGQVVSQMTK